MCEKTKNYSSPSWPQLEHIIKRNFGGLELDELNPYEEFEKLIPMRREPPNLTDVPTQVTIVEYIGTVIKNDSSSAWFLSQ